jgi:1-acyl-sn-glycerol-3-phosphate acyltransferase
MTGLTKAKEESQFGLLKIRRFAPFFWTQFFGAFNDNIFKNALILIIAYQGVRQLPDTNSNVMINMAAGALILPFFLFSALAGDISDKYEKSSLIRYIKLAEIAIMALAAVAFYFSNIAALMLLLFLLGTQAAFFGPVKYSILPQHLQPGELVGGNAMVEMGTFIAILLGTIGGGILIQMQSGPRMVGAAVLLVACAGYAASRFIPEAQACSPGLKIKWNPVTETWKTVQLVRDPDSVFKSILGISWFWFLGASYLTQLPAYTRDTLHSSESVVTLLLALFSIGVGAGSLMCERLSGRKVELGLVPLGSIGLSIFGFDIFFAYHAPQVSSLMGLREFLNSPGSMRVVLDFIMIGVSGGLFIVPLYAFIQMRTRPEIRSRVIAANNILNALFMVLASIMGAVLLSRFELSIPQFFLVLVILNVTVALYIYSVIPEFTMRFLVWVMTGTMYRVKTRDLHYIPDEGAAVVVCNHVSLVDGPLIAGACRRPIRFVVFEPIYRLPVLHFIFKTGKAIPIDSRARKPEVYNRAMEQISRALREGEIVGIFPEGEMTHDGEVGVFKQGIEKIIRENPVPVIPLALRGLWGSFFSNDGGYAMTHWPKRFWSRVELLGGPPVPPGEVTAAGLKKIVEQIRGEYK